MKKRAFRRRAWRRLALCRLARQHGQSTVEFVIIAAAFVSLVAALGALAGLQADGTVPRHALATASHHLGGGDAGAWDDVLAY